MCNVNWEVLLTPLPHAIEFERVSKSYGAFLALSPIDLAIGSKEFFTLLGPSGSGKSTILNIVTGAVQPTEGRVFLHGKDVTKAAPNKRNLGMVFQNYSLMPHMTVFENVAFPLRVRRIREAEINRRVGRVLEMVSLPDLAKRRPSDLSGGQQQRIAIARCLVYEPSVILMDEPLGALDKKLREQLQFEIKSIHKGVGIPIVYVTHDQDEAMAMSDRICLMNKARIEQIGTPSELYANPKTVFAADFIGDSNIFRCKVKSSRGQLVLEGPGGCAIVADGSAVPEGTDVHAMVRPESMRLLESTEQTDNVVSGTLVECSLVGGVWRILVQYGGTALKCKYLPSSDFVPPTVGMPCRLGWARQKTVVLNA